MPDLSSHYRGRFAPSPTGLLHFGSLVTALASYLDARANQGVWLVRIEDIDPPREQLKAADLILFTLEKYGLFWDETVRFQQTQHDIYQEKLEYLINNQFTYLCFCSRKNRKAATQICQGECKENYPPDTPHSINLKCPTTIEFFDQIYQHKTLLLSKEGPCLLKRKGGLFSYQLAVVIDDLSQKITHIVRGSDLLHSTGWQIVLIEALHGKKPHYIHIPIVRDNTGQKLSKQRKAMPVSLKKPHHTLYQALTYLNMKPDIQLAQASISDILSWGIKNWNLKNIVPS